MRVIASRGTWRKHGGFRGSTKNVWGIGVCECRVVKETFGWSGFKFPASVLAGAAWERSAVPVIVRCEDHFFRICSQCKL